MNPSIERDLRAALEYHQQRKFYEAEAIYRHVLVTLPDQADVLHFLAVLLTQTGRPALSLELLRKAITLNPNNVAYRFSLANALRDVGALDQAISVSRHAIGMEPNYAPAWNDLGGMLARAGDINESQQAFEKAIAIQPDFADAHYNLGNLLTGRSELEKAMLCYRRAIEILPNMVEAHDNLGLALVRAGNLAGAIASHRKATEVNPKYARAFNNLGVALNAMRLHDEAIASYRKSIELDPRDPAAHNNLANALKMVGLISECLGEFDLAMRQSPNDAAIASNYVYTYFCCASSGGEEKLREARQWNERFGKPSARFMTHPNDRQADRRIRVGYISTDFRDHVVGIHLLPTLAAHDRENFEIFMYSSTRRPDAMTDKFKSLGYAWRDVSNVNDMRAAEMIHADGIDILMDLSLHTSGTRLRVSALKPAPVQGVYAGYPGTTGMDAIDFRVSDPYLDPPGNEEPYSEMTLRLADSFWCYDPPDAAEQISALPTESNSFITFGCLNSSYKISQETLELWAGVLKAVASSKLLVLLASEGARHRLWSSMESLGIQRNRIETIGWQARSEYFKSFNRIDISLDTLPCNGHITSLDSMWMGVPVVTMVGKTVMGRATFAQLCNLSLQELSATTTDEFTRIAVELANNQPKLAKLRAELRARMQKSALCNPKKCAAGLEAAYRQAWQKWCDKVQN